MFFNTHKQPNTVENKMRNLETIKKFWLYLVKSEENNVIKSTIYLNKYLIKEKITS